MVFQRRQFFVHLTKIHHIHADVYGPILKSFQNKTLAEHWSNLSRPTDGSAPIEGLKAEPGYVCTGCGCYTTSKDTAEKHLKCGQVRQVHLQRWNRISAPTYWIVVPPTVPPIDAAVNGSVTSQAGTPLPPPSSLSLLLFFDDIEEPSLQKAAFQKLLQRERRLVEEEETRRIEVNLRDNMNPWLRFTQWPLYPYLLS